MSKTPSPADLERAQKHLNAMLVDFGAGVVAGVAAATEYGGGNKGGGVAFWARPSLQAALPRNKD
jgi:hypothetical protein